MRMFRAFGMGLVKVGIGASLAGMVVCGPRGMTANTRVGLDIRRAGSAENLRLAASVANLDLE